MTRHNSVTARPGLADLAHLVAPVSGPPPSAFASAAAAAFSFAGAPAREPPLSGGVVVKRKPSFGLSAQSSLESAGSFMNGGLRRSKR